MKELAKNGMNMVIVIALIGWMIFSIMAYMQVQEMKSFVSSLGYGDSAPVEEQE